MWDLSTLKIFWCLINDRRKNKINKKRFCNIMQCMQQGSGKELQEIRALTNSFCSWSYLFLIHTSTCLHTASKQEKILWMGISIARGNVKWKGDNRKGRVKAKRRSPGQASDSRHRRPPSLVTLGRGCWQPRAPLSRGHPPPRALLLLLVGIGFGRRGCQIKIRFYFASLGSQYLEWTCIFPLWDYLGVSRYSYIVYLPITIPV